MRGGMSLASKRNAASPIQEDRSRRQERADRILDAAAELILRWGYKKTTIDDIAKQAGVAKGTIYLHWKTRESLFRALLIRERYVVSVEVLAALQHDRESALLHRVVRHTVSSTLKSPLITALFLRDTEMLG